MPPELTVPEAGTRACQALSPATRPSAPAHAAGAERVPRVSDP